MDRVRVPKLLALKRMRNRIMAASAIAMLALSMSVESFSVPSKTVLFSSGSRILNSRKSSTGLYDLFGQNPESSLSSSNGSSRGKNSTTLGGALTAEVADGETNSDKTIIEFLDNVDKDAKPSMPNVLSATPPSQQKSEGERLRTMDTKGEGNTNPLLETNFINNEGKATIGIMRSENGKSNADNNNNNNDQIPYGNIGSKPGIGGDGGLVYDVNRLKRNLLQETMATYKSDLLLLLNSHSSTEAEVTEKLAALVQASPVRTTTDSNLLDGAWGLCYQSKYTSPRDLQNIYPARSRQSDLVRQTPASRRLGGKESLWRSHQRVFYLENLKDYEDAYILDNDFYFGGLVTQTTRYCVEGLTRTSLRIRPLSKTWSMAGQAVRNTSTLAPTSEVDDRSSNEEDEQVSNDGSTNCQFVYADVDLCIVADASRDSFSVYTKSTQWISARKRRQRKWRFACSYVPLLYRKLIPSREGRTTDTVDVLKTRKSPVIREIYSEEARLRVLKLGDLDDDRRRQRAANGEDTTDDDEAWEGSHDPFVHLSADERQRLLKNMRVRDIEQAGSDHRRNLARRWLERVFRRRKTYFRKPY